MQETDYREGEKIWRIGEDAQELFVVEEGNVCVVEDYLQQSQDESLVPFPEGLVHGSNARY